MLYDPKLLTRRRSPEQLSSVRPVCVQGSAELHQGLHDSLQMLQLLAREDQPGAEHDIQEVRHDHGEKEPVYLNNEHEGVKLVAFYFFIYKSRCRIYG